MKQNFDIAFAKLLEHEGGYVNDKNDPGGVTNLGITKRTYESYLNRSVSVAEMRDLEPHQVKPIYYNSYWRKSGCNELPVGLDYCVFDFAVHSGVSKAVKALQKAVGAEPDGKFGHRTETAVREVCMAGSKVLPKGRKLTLAERICGLFRRQAYTASMTENTCRLIATICNERMKFLEKLRIWKHYKRGFTRRVKEVKLTAMNMSKDTIHTFGESEL